MRTFYCSLVSFVIFTLVLSSCQDPGKPKIPVDPLIQERDSLLSIYGGNLVNQEFDYLKSHKLGSTSNIYLYGKRNGLFWLGIFESSEKLIQEYEMDLDLEHRFSDIFYEIKAPSFLISSYELFDVFGSEKEEEEQDAIFSKSIVRIELENHEPKFHTSYLSQDELTWIEFARV